MGLNPKNAASNHSMPSSTPAARTKSGRAALAEYPPEAATSGSEKNEMDSTPLFRLFQNSERLRAPGNRPLIPMIAIPSSAGECWASVISASSQPPPSVESALLSVFGRAPQRSVGDAARRRDRSSALP